MKDRVLRVTRVLLIALVAGVVVGGFGGWVMAQFLHVPMVDQLASYEFAATTEVLADDGEPLAEFALERRVELGPEQIPEHLKLAVVAAEDADFFEHGGVDPKAIFRAAFYSVVEGEIGARGGASTLTQQLALNLFLERDRTLRRKMREALLAIDIEKRYSKDQIITMYLNLVFFGHGAYGVEAASRLYYGKPAAELELDEAALLAGMIPSPNRKFDPIDRPDSARARRDWVLERMLELGFIDSETCAEAIGQPVEVSLHRGRIDTGAYFVEMVRQEIEHRFGTDALYTGGLRVRTSLDADLQRIAEEAVREGLVGLEMEQLGFRDPPNVVRDGRATSAAEFVHPSWRQLEPSPGAMVHAVVTEVGRREARLRIADRTANLSLDGAEWTGARSLTRLLEAGDLVLVRLPETIPGETDDEPAETGADGENDTEIEAADEPLAVSLLQEPKIEGALIAMDNRTGAILALVGGFDFSRSEFNRAVQSSLQCGSAFKPFVYLTAFSHGYTPADVLFDAPILLPDGSGELTYCPKNYYNKYYGITTLRRALELSFNASAVKLQQLVGGESVVETATKFGITSDLHPYPSLALGSIGVRPIELVRAYAGIANLGELPEPYFIAEIHDRDGRLQERFYPRSERIMPAAVTYLGLHVLEGVIDRGTGASAAGLDAHLAGKTGTTDNYSDAWFVGFSPRITVGVWVGRDLKQPIGRRMTGARAAQPIWNRFMAAYLDRLPEEVRAEEFSVPPGVVFSPVDWYTGLRVVPTCAAEAKVILESFLDGTEPTAVCESELMGLHELPWPFQRPFYEPKPGEPMPTAEALEVADDRITGEDEEASSAAG